MPEFYIYAGLLITFLVAWSIGRNSGRREAADKLINIEKSAIEKDLQRHKTLEDKAAGLFQRVALQEQSSLKRISTQERIAREQEERVSSLLSALKNDGALLPSLVRWADNIREIDDKQIAKSLLKKKRPALKASKEVEEISKRARENKRLADTLQNQIDLYESLAPWLRDYTELTVEEVLSGLSQPSVDDRDVDENPAKKYLSKSEWEALDEEEKLQRSLENYLNPSRKRTLWEIGIEFERYIGYTFEKDGCKVIFHGARHGLSDLGIDLICQKESRIYIVQCKRLSALKEIPVRENVVAQIFGAAKFYGLKNKVSKEVEIQPVLITSYILSDQAREFANHLGVEVRENIIMEPYPIVKCNINPSTEEKIFHLPFDQQYDNIVVGDVEGEFYAGSVKEAVERGFRHAYRWRSNRQCIS